VLIPVLLCRVTVLVVNGEVASPIDKLLAAFRNRDADKIAEENQPVRAVMLTDNAKRILMGREGDCSLPSSSITAKPLASPNWTAVARDGNFKR